MKLILVFNININNISLFLGVCLSCMLYITIYILISYIIIMASVDPCFLIDITDIDIGLVIS